MTKAVAEVNVMVEEEMTAEEFGFYLLSMRENLGINQASMSELLGYNKNTYNAYENGKRLPRDWKSIDSFLRNHVKEHIKQMRETAQYVTVIDEELGEEIINMHSLGRNVVQIGTRLDIEEDKVETYLVSKGYTPQQYFPGWD